jgi:hypothetical protein
MPATIIAISGVACGIQLPFVQGAAKRLSTSIVSSAWLTRAPFPG